MEGFWVVKLLSMWYQVLHNYMSCHFLTSNSCLHMKILALNILYCNLYWFISLPLLTYAPRLDCKALGTKMVFQKGLFSQCLAQWQLHSIVQLQVYRMGEWMNEPINEVSTLSTLTILSSYRTRDSMSFTIHLLKFPTLISAVALTQAIGLLPSIKCHLVSIFSLLSFCQIPHNFPPTHKVC